MFKYVLRTVGGMQPHVNKVADTAAFRVKKGIACHATSVVRVNRYLTIPGVWVARRGKAWAQSCAPRGRNPR